MKSKQLPPTNIAPKRTIRGGYCFPANVAHDECSPTITARYDAVGSTNILSLAHYPMCVVLMAYEI